MHSIPWIDWIHWIDNTVRIDWIDWLDWIDVIVWIDRIDWMDWRNWMHWSKTAALGCIGRVTNRHYLLLRTRSATLQNRHAAGSVIPPI
jgi:hypothetical protein